MIKATMKTLYMEEGTLVLFKGLNSLHRVTPTIGNRNFLVVLAYNNKAGVSSSKNHFLGDLINNYLI